MTVRRTRRHRADEAIDRGSATIEMALLMPILFVLLFGIISYGVLFAFKHSNVQSVNEAARGGLQRYQERSQYTLTTVTAQYNDVTTQAINQVSASLGWNKSCGTPTYSAANGATATSGGMSCTATMHDCNSASIANSEGTLTNVCLTVRVVYNYSTHPIIPRLPLISATLPTSLTSQATVTVIP